jgi:hypothetical protein
VFKVPRRIYYIEGDLNFFDRWLQSSPEPTLKKFESMGYEVVKIEEAHKKHVFRAFCDPYTVGIIITSHGNRSGFNVVPDEEFKRKKGEKVQTITPQHFEEHLKELTWFGISKNLRFVVFHVCNLDKGTIKGFANVFKIPEDHIISSASAPRRETSWGENDLFEYEKGTVWPWDLDEMMEDALKFVSPDNITHAVDTNGDRIPDMSVDRDELPNSQLIEQPSDTTHAVDTNGDRIPDMSVDRDELPNSQLIEQPSDTTHAVDTNGDRIPDMSVCGDELSNSQLIEQPRPQEPISTTSSQAASMKQHDDGVDPFDHDGPGYDFPTPFDPGG